MYLINLLTIIVICYKLFVVGLLLGYDHKKKLMIGTIFYVELVSRRVVSSDLYFVFFKLVILV